MLAELRLFETGIASELVALAAATFELPTGGPSDFIDLTGVRALLGSKMNACALGCGREPYLAKMTRLDRVGEVVTPALSPAYEVCFGNKNTTVVSGAAACAAGQAIEFFHIGTLGA